MKKIIVTIVVIGIIVAILATVVVFATRNTEEKSLTTKAEEQIRYLEDKIIAMTNHLNQIHFSNSILVEKNTDEDSNSQKQNEQSNETGSEGSSQQGQSSQQSSSGESSSSSSSQGSQNEQQTSSSEDSLQYEIKNNSILSNTTKEVDWEYMKTNAEIIYSTWPSMMVDLHELNVKNEDILNFSSSLDQVTLAAKQEDKSVTLNNLANLYGFLPNYRSQISENKDEINIDYTKACLLNSYALVEQEQWEEVKKQLENAISYFSNIMNSINGNGQKQSHISKIYVLLNELNKTIDYKDKQLFYIKYRNAMEELVNF